MWTMPFIPEWPEPPLPEMAPPAPPEPPPPPPDMAPAGDPLRDMQLDGPGGLLGPAPGQAPIGSPGGAEVTPIGFNAGPGGQGGPQGPYDPRKLRDMDPKTQQLFKYLNDKYYDDINLTSGYRSPSYNRKVGGARNSQHMYGRAFDLNANRRWRTDDLARFTSDAYGKAKELGVPLSAGYYGMNPRSGHALHLDTRSGGGVTWGANRRGNTTPGWLAGAVRGQGPQPDPRYQTASNSQGGVLGPGGPSGMLPPGAEPQGRAQPPLPGQAGPQLFKNPQNVRPPNDPGSTLHGANQTPPLPGSKGPGAPIPGREPQVAGSGAYQGGLSEYEQQYLEAARAADRRAAEEQEYARMQQAFAGLGKGIEAAGKASSRFAPNVPTSGMRSAANAKGLDATAFAQQMQLPGARSPSAMLDDLRRRALFA